MTARTISSSDGWSAPGGGGRTARGARPIGSAPSPSMASSRPRGRRKASSNRPSSRAATASQVNRRPWICTASASSFAATASCSSSQARSAAAGTPKPSSVGIPAGSTSSRPPRRVVSVGTPWWAASNGTSLKPSTADGYSTSAVRR